MSNVIDHRIVEMDFDNSNFERNAKTSLSTIDKLKNALNFKGASNSLNELSKSASSFNMDSLGSAATLVTNKFSAMEVIGVGALMRIGQQAVDAGERLVKSMSTDQIMAGWDKFAKKTTSTATLLGQGFNMDEVTTQLEKLNWFTDETSYNFTDMVDSIGKFTASGKGLTESVDAMQGIATWAALSGQNAQTASRAMYQLSQAMGAGVMRKEDYKSIQNAAMDTDEFRQKALDAAVALGTLKKNADGTYQSLKATGKGAEAFTKAQFAEHLTEGMWFTDKVMMRVFNDYSKGVEEIYQFADANDLLASDIIGAKDALDKGEDALADYLDELELKDDVRNGLFELAHNLDDFGVKAFSAAQKARTFGDAIDSVKDAASTTWMNIFEVFIGDAEQATEVWTDLANYLWDVFVGPINSLHKALKDVFKIDGTREEFINIFRNMAGVFEELVKPIKKAFKEIFPKNPNRAANFRGFIDNLNKLLNKMKLNETRSAKLKTAFEGLFTVLKVGLKIIKNILQALKPVGALFVVLFDTILSLSEAIGKVLTKADKGIHTVRTINGAINTIIDTLISLIHMSIIAFDDIFERIKHGQDVISSVLKFVETEARQIVTHLISLVFNLITEITGIDTSKIKNFFFKIVNTIWKAIDEFVDNFKNKGGLKGVIKIFLNLLKDVGVAILDTFEEITGIDTRQMKLKFEGLIDNIKENLIKFVSAFDGMDSITDKFNKLADSVQRVADFFKPLTDTLKTFAKTVLEKIAQYPWLSFTGILNIKMITEIIRNMTVLTNSTIGSVSAIKQTFGDLKDNVSTAIKEITKSLKDTQESLKSKTLLAIAIATLMLASAFLMISAVNGEKVSSTIAAFSAVMGEMVIAFGSLAFLSNILTSIGVAKILVTLGILIGVVYAIGEAFKDIATSYISDEQMLLSLGMLCASLLALIVVIEILNLVSYSIGKANLGKIFVLGLIFDVLGIAMKSMANAMAALNGMDSGSMLAAFAELLVGLWFMCTRLADLQKLNTKGMIKAAISLVIVAKALAPLAEAIAKLSVIEPQKIVIPFIAISAGLNALCDQAAKLSSKKVFLRTAISLILIAKAVDMLMDTVIKVSEYPFTKLIVGFSIIALMFFALTEVSKALDESIIKIGVGFLAISIGLKLIADAIIAMQACDITKLATSMVILGLALFSMMLVTEHVKDNLKGVEGLLLLSAAIYIIAQALKTIASEDLVKLGVDFIILAGAMAVMALIASKAEECLPGAAALLILSGAFIIFAFGLKTLAAADPKSLFLNLLSSLGYLVLVIGGLIGMAAIFNSVGWVLVAGAGMFALALLAISVGLAALGGSIILLSLGVDSLSMTGKLAGEAMHAIVSAFTGNIGTLLKGAVALAAMGYALVVASIGTGLFAVAGAAFAIALLGMSIGFAVFVGTLKLMSKWLMEFADIAPIAAVALTTFGIALVKMVPGIIGAAIAMLAIILPMSILSAVNIVFAASAVTLGGALLVLGAGFVAFSEGALTFVEAVDKIVKAFLSYRNGVKNMQTDTSTAMTKTSNDLRKTVSVFGQIGSMVVSGFANGMSKEMPRAVAMAAKLVALVTKITKLKLLIRSPSRVFAEIGQYTVKGFAKGMEDTRESDAAAENMADSAVKSLNSAMTSAYDNLDSDVSDPVIKPVMDLTDVQNGNKDLNAMLSKDKAESINATYKSSREYEEENAKANSSLLSGLNSKILAAISENSNSDLPINVNITLAGDAEGIFRVVMNENSRMIKTAGYSPLLR